jgi:uncharacterized protein YbjT (DUF2867 family)
MSKKMIAVVGATGAQGGGLARAILGDPRSEFSVRALTRHPESAKGRELAQLGAEVVAADLDDVESLRRAFAGAHGAFCMTNFWEHHSPERETAQARVQAQAARDAGVQHAIWSTLEDTRKWMSLEDPRMPTLQGKYKVPHFDAKGESDRFFSELGVPTTWLLTCFYWDNLRGLLNPQRGPDGKLGLPLPMADKKLPGIAAEDIGRCAYGIFQRGAELTGKRVGIAGEHLTGEQMAATLSRAVGQEVAYRYVPPEIFRTLPFPGADDMANMFQFKRDFEQDYCGARDVGFTRTVNPALQTFAQWLERNKASLPFGR